MQVALTLLTAIVVAVVCKIVLFPSWRRLGKQARSQGAMFFVSGGPEIYFYRTAAGGKLEHAHAEYWTDLRRFDWSPEPNTLTWVPCEGPLPLPRRSLKWVR